MRDNRDLTKTSIASFEEIASYAKTDIDNTCENIFVGSNFSVTTGCNPFFKTIIKEKTPVRLDVMRVGIVKTGWCEPVIGFKKYHCSPGDLLFVNWGAILTDDAFGVDTTFAGINMTADYMRMIFDGKLPELFLSPGQCFSLHLTEEEQATWELYMHTLYGLVQLKGMELKTVCSLFSSVLNFVHSLYRAKIEVQWKYKSWNKQTVERFIRLVNDYAKTEHETDFYASKLCMTSHYLGIVIKKETGITAKEWIDKTLTALILLELRYTNKSLKMIACEFNFVSLSSLCKFFKRRMGITATAYRMMSENLHSEDSLAPFEADGTFGEIQKN